MKKILLLLLFIAMPAAAHHPSPLESQVAPTSPYPMVTHQSPYIGSTEPSTAAHKAHVGCLGAVTLMLLHFSSPWAIVPAIYAVGTYSQGPAKDSSYDWVGAGFGCLSASIPWLI